MKFVNESIDDVLKPKSEKEINDSVKEIEARIKGFMIRDDAMHYVASILGGGEQGWDYNVVLSEIVYYLSDNEFNEALIHIIRENLKIK